MNVHADIVFLGDSITHQSDFSKSFQDKTICNLGIGEDTIVDITNRSSMFLSVRPDKIFLLCGANSLRNDNIDQCVSEYQKLVEKLLNEYDSELYIISFTPISKEKSESGAIPSTIISFNEKIHDIAASHSLTYIDIFTPLSDGSYIKPEYTTDGIHLTPAGYDVWANAIRPYV